MAYSAIVKPQDYFNTLLYTGNGGTQTISGVGFQPDFAWIKNRSGAGNHMLQNAVRGSTKHLHSNTTDIEVTDATGVTSFNSDGFVVGSNGNLNGNGTTTASWNWKANGTGAANTAGSINTTVSVNTTSGFSIVKWTGNSTAGETIGHGLGVTPKVVIIKRLSGSTQSWICKFPTATDGYLALNATDAISASSGWLPVSSSLITLANNWSAYNNNGNDFIAYCFADVQGYSKFGSYTGNGNADGTFIYTGFKPAWIMVKKTNDTHAWRIYDSVRDTYNVTEKILEPNTSNAEATSSTYIVDLVSNGFKFRGNGDGVNGSGQSFIYMAFAANPLVANSGTDGVPATAR